MATYRIIKETEQRIDGEKIWYKVTRDGEYIPNSYSSDIEGCERLIKKITETPVLKEEIVKEVIIND